MDDSRSSGDAEGGAGIGQPDSFLVNWDDAAPLTDFSYFEEHWDFISTEDHLNPPNHPSPLLSSSNFEQTPQATTVPESSSNESLLVLTPFGSSPGLAWVGSPASIEQPGPIDAEGGDDQAGLTVIELDNWQPSLSNYDEMFQVMNDEGTRDNAAATAPIPDTPDILTSTSTHDSTPDQVDSGGGSTEGGREKRTVEASSSLAAPAGDADPIAPVPAFNCFAAMRPLLPNPTPRSESYGPISTPPTASSFLPNPRKIRQNTDAGRAKIKSVRRVGACLRCRIYRESVCLVFTLPMALFSTNSL